MARKRHYHESAHDKMEHRRNLKGHSHMRDEGHHSPMDGHKSAMFEDGDMKYPHENPNARASHMGEMHNDEYKRDRGNEQAVYRRFRAEGNEFYAGMEPRRRQEMEDAGYIHEDHDQIANLPQYPIVKSYPKTGPYLPEGLEDSIRGIDHQMDYDDDKRREHFYPKKV